jgi:hypothetical protein
MRRSHYVVGLVPVTDANYVQRRLKWDKPASDYSEQRKRELAEMDDAQREPLREDHVIGRLLPQEPLANTARLLVERLQTAERELQAREEELATLRAEAPTKRRRRSLAVDRVEQALKELYPPSGDPGLIPIETTVLDAVNAVLKARYDRRHERSTLFEALARIRPGG